MTSDHQVNPVERLRETLRSVGQAENPFRHQLAPVVAALDRMLRLVPDELPPDIAPVALYDAADRVERALGAFNGDASTELDPAMKELRRELATSLIVDFDPEQQRSIDELASIADEVEEASRRAKTHAEHIDHLLDAAKRLVSNAADDKLAAHYRTQADAEKDAANWWRRATVTGLLMTVVLALVAAGIAIFGEEDLTPILSTGGLGLATAGLTGFLGAQTGLHRARETRYRTAELQLAVIGPMIDAISSDSRDEVRAEIAKRLLELGSPDR